MITMNYLYKSYLSRILIFFSIFIILVVDMFFNTSTGKGAVTLVYFRPTYSDGKVYFEWKTASEIDNSGYIINRLKKGGNYNNVQDYERLEYAEDQYFYPALGEGGIYYAEYYSEDGDLVRFYDDDVDLGNTYWYILESVDVNSNSQYSDPVSVFAGSTPTPTHTRTVGATTTNTPTITRTSKPTKTKSASEKTNTPVATATRTYGYLAASATPQPPANHAPTIDLAATEAMLTAQANQISSTPQPTATLIPLPSITMLFPTAAADASEENPVNVREDMRKTSSTSWFTPQRMMVVLVIATIWIMLGGWFYLSFKRLEK